MARHGIIDNSNQTSYHENYQQCINTDQNMSQSKKGKFPTNNKKYSINETNSYIPFLERAFLRLRQLNESVNNLLSDLGIDTSDLGELDLLNNNDASNEATYIKLTDLKLFLSAIQNTVRELSSTGCLIDNLDEGKVVWPADHEENSAEIFWSFGDQHCKLVTKSPVAPDDIYLIPDQAITEARFNED